MRKMILATVTALSIGGMTTGALIAHAQPAPPPPGPQGAEFDGPPGHHPHWGGWMHHHREGRGPGPGEFRKFALVYPHKDRQLTPPDVQKIAEGFLLWNGNHDWKVVDVGATTDGPIGFSLATKDGSVIAHFTMDPHTGKIARVD